MNHGPLFAQLIVRIWNDVNDTRGFTIFDTQTLEHTPIDNPHRLFYNVYYDDTNYKLFNGTEYQDKIVKVIVKKKTNQKQFEKFIDKLYTLCYNFNTFSSEL